MMTAMPTATIKIPREWGCLKCGKEIGASEISVSCSNAACDASYHSACYPAIENLVCDNPTCPESWLASRNYKAIAAKMLQGSIEELQTGNPHALPWPAGVRKGVAFESTSARAFDRMMSLQTEEGFWHGWLHPKGTGALRPFTSNVHIQSVIATKIAQAVRNVIAALNGPPEGAPAGRDIALGEYKDYLKQALTALCNNPSSKTVAPIAEFARFFNTIYQRQAAGIDAALAQIVDPIPGALTTAGVEAYGEENSPSGLRKYFTSVLAAIAGEEGGKLSVVRLKFLKVPYWPDRTLYAVVVALQIAALIVGLLYKVSQHRPGTFDGPTVGPNPPMPTVGPAPTGEPVEFFITLLSYIWGAVGNVGFGFIIAAWVALLLFCLIKAIFGTFRRFFYDLGRFFSSCATCCYSLATCKCCKGTPTGEGRPLLQRPDSDT